MRTRWRTALVALALAAGGGSRPGEIQVLPGSPLPGITARELELFRLGLDDFTEVETPEDGLGPTFNGNSCAVCHSVPAIGGVSSMTEVRAGYRDEAGKFTALNGGTLYHLFSIPPHRCQVQIPPEANVIARRAPIPVFGAGLVEAIADEAIVALEDPDDRDIDGISGRAARIADVASGRERIGRFGWKAQQATLLAFAGDAYRNEMGITNCVPGEPGDPGNCTFGKENTSNGNSVAAVDGVADPEDDGDDVEAFAEFMRATKVPPRGPITADVQAGDVLFDQMACGFCHTRTIQTAPVGTVINAGKFTVSAALGDKRIHPFGDFMLHALGTGDGIVQNGGPNTRNMIRTAPLWGVRTRNRLMHDGESLTFNDAILRHGGDGGTHSANNFRNLSAANKRRLIAFLKSL